MNEAEARDLLASTGALLSGHFLLSSGRHSDTYVEKARVFERPALTVRFADEIVARYEDVEAVATPAIGAIPFGFAVALGARARFLFAERDGATMSFRRGFSLERGERTLVVEDVVTTGGSAAEVLAVVDAAGAEALGVAALVDRSTDRLPFRLDAILRVEARSWDAAECLLCAAGVPLTERGSRNRATGDGLEASL